jgi:hypothetical protein
MKRYYSGAHANRVRLSNGGWMSLRAYRETLTEMYPPEPKEPYVDTDAVASLEEQTASLRKRIGGLETLAKARRDTGFQVDITKMYEEEI